MDKTLYTLVNPEFDFNWNGKSYHVRKANLEKVVLYQERARALAKDGSGEMKLVGYCIYLILRDSIPDLTEEQVMKDAPGDIDSLEIMLTLGFLNEARMKALLSKKVLPTGDVSSSSSPSEQDGHQEKSADSASGN